MAHELDALVQRVELAEGLRPLRELIQREERAGARACFDSSGKRNPSTSSSPSSAIACAVSIRIVVVLPAPFGPSRPTHVPYGTSRSTPPTAVISP
jgi:hypothetical protein